ncbi:MAG TPA: L-2-amino-thiazoline-4-carboxylic acid hydrolase, partial [Anaerolineales bacterium]|nr:L-2-amino-thiazoline-4-carboxylic acid hydrolase [Anaerolineales bacterium]
DRDGGIGFPLVPELLGPVGFQILNTKENTMDTKLNSLSRRAFLRLMAIAASGTLFSGCLPQGSEPTVSEADYYVAQADQLLKDFDDNLPYFNKVLQGDYTDAEIRDINRETRQHYADLILQLPYIGGETNGLTYNLIQSTWCLAFYQVLQARGRTVEDVGRMLYKLMEAMGKAYPPGLSRIAGLVETSGLSLDRLKAEAEISQQRRYAEDWVFTAVEGNGDDFDLGVDYTECGICKFFQAQHASELTPYMCLLDFPMSVTSDAGLVRTMTLANGDAKCDFRYKLGRPTQPLLPPGFLEGT